MSVTGRMVKLFATTVQDLLKLCHHSRSKTQSVTDCFLVQIIHIMKTRFNLFRRAGVFYTEDTTTGKQTSLRTRDETEAKSLLNARNEAQRQPVLNLHLARAYLTASDPAFVERTWQVVMDHLQSRGKDSSRERYASVFKSASFNGLRNKKLLETTAADFFAVFKDGKVSIVYFLKRLHNFAVHLGWIAIPIVAPYLWPKYEPKDRRGITPDEHQSVLAMEKNAEWKLYLELLWETGAAQSDAVNFKTEDIDWQSRTISYFRMKTGSLAQFTISKKLETVLSHLPTTGALFPKLSTFTANDRASQSATAPHCEHQKTSITQNTPGCLGGTRGRHRAARQKNQGRRKKAEWRGYTLLRNVTSPEGADCPLGTPIARACRP